MIAPYLDYALVGPMAGFQAETQVHALRLIMSGLFDRYPDLHMVLGHLGEGIPFFIDRIDRAAENTINHRVPKLGRKPSDYFLDNFVVTTSGMNSPNAVRYCIDVLGIDRVLFALDYPYETMMPDASALDGLGLPDADMAKLFHGNAERVFSL
jgi:2,3-dihydroxybenzoate decarboxylase